MTEIPEQQESDGEVAGTVKPEGLYFDLANAKNAPQQFADLDSYVRFRLQMTLDYIDKFSRELNNGTAMYEKLILLDGTAIALSITLLGALSSRWATVHGGERPHLWVVDVAWSLLLLSVFCSYQVIVRRHSAILTLFLNFSSEFTKYMYQRIGVTASYLKHILKGEVAVGDEKIDVSKIFGVLPSILDKEKEDLLKQTTETIAVWKSGASKEGIFVKVAVYSTILAVALLCIFTIQSVSLLF